MALINTTTTGIQGTTIFADGTGSLTVQQNGATLGTYGNIPAFRAYPTDNITLAYNTLTKVTLGTEEYDTNNNFASSTFTPTIAGYYQINGTIHWTGTAGRNMYAAVFIHKNGAIYKRNVIAVNSLGSGIDWSNEVNSLVYFNGTTDYIEMYAYQVDYTTSGTITINGGSSGQYSSFSGILIKAA
jgi:hypothetical protein